MIGTFPRVRSFLREFFLLRQAEAAARASAPRKPRAQALLDAAGVRIQSAESLASADTLGALVLYREAVALIGDAWGAESRTSSEAIRHALAEVPEPQRAALTLTLDALERDAPLAFDEMTVDARAELRRDAVGLVEWMLGKERRLGLMQVRIVRAMRLAGAALALVLVGRVAYGALFASPNRALHKPVVATSRWAGTPDPSGLTDGVRSGLGIATGSEPSPTITVDLGIPYQVDRIRVYPRTDCCPDDALPLVVEVGDQGDATPFVAERTTHFDVWEVDVGGHKASTIRIKTRRNPGYIALAELEVFGKR